MTPPALFLTLDWRLRSPADERAARRPRAAASELRLDRCHLRRQVRGRVVVEDTAVGLAVRLRDERVELIARLLRLAAAEGAKGVLEVLGETARGAAPEFAGVDESVDVGEDLVDQI